MFDVSACPSNKQLLFSIQKAHTMWKHITLLLLIIRRWKNIILPRMIKTPRSRMIMVLLCLREEFPIQKE